MRLTYPYQFDQRNLPSELTLTDHLRGFDKDLHNQVLHQLNSAGRPFEIVYHQILLPTITEKYKNLNIRFSASLQNSLNLGYFKKYNVHPIIDYKNFVCSFNGTGSVSRQLLSSILNNQHLFNFEYCSKNFSSSNKQICNQLNSLDLSDSEVSLYSKFFINNDEFNNYTHSFGQVSHLNNDKDIYVLEDKLTQSFLHIVSETMATSYYPFVTEKFLYSIVTRGLFLGYAHPGWHAHLTKYYGFKHYNKIFNYSFDNVKNPVKRLINLIEMISKYAKLSSKDWTDLYQMEQDTIEFNYDHYYSGNYLKHLAKFE